MDCSDWDYCSGCIKRAPILHNPEHRFKPIYEPEPEPEPEPIPVPDSASQFTRSVSQRYASPTASLLFLCCHVPFHIPLSVLHGCDFFILKLTLLPLL